MSAVKKIAVIGLAFRFPGTTKETYWTDLTEGRDLVTKVADDRWEQEIFLHPNKNQPGTSYTFAAGSIGDIAGFDAGFFGISPREAAQMDPQQRLLLELVWETLEDAGIAPRSVRGSDCGVFIGIAGSDYAQRVSDDLDVIESMGATGNTASIAANRLSYVYDLKGPSMAIDTACSSSLVAFHQACNAIRVGESTLALAGGINLHAHPQGFISFAKATMLSQQGRCRVFDASGDGYVRSEGAGMFLLKDYDAAIADGNRILAVVAHSAVNTDGHKSGLTVPSADMQAQLLSQTYASAGISADDIAYIEAHGTGTAVGDPIETRALGDALGSQRQLPLPIGSVKSNMGHLETASGAAGLVKAIYSLQHGMVPATIGIQQLNPHIQVDDWNLHIVTDNLPLPPAKRQIIGINSFGFGGSNAHVILENPPAQTVTPPASRSSADPAPSLPFIVSGKSREALAANAKCQADFLRQQPAERWYDIAYHSFYRREWLDQRALFYAHTPHEAITLLDALANTQDTPNVTLSTRLPAPAKGAVFVYSGNGCQWQGMGKQLLQDPVFYQALTEVNALFEPLAGFSLIQELQGDNGDDRYVRTEIAQPALFALQVGVTRMLASQGVYPQAVTGHSVGEVAAAWACGALSLPDAVQVIYHRSRLQGTTQGSGQMTAVSMGAEDAALLLGTLGLAQDISIAGANSWQGITAAGSAQALTQFETALQQQQTPFKRLALDYAFHSPAMDSIQQGVESALSQIQPQATHIPFYSTVTGAILDGTALDATYWWHNIRKPVLFEDVLNGLAQDDYNLLTEIGGHPVLRGYINAQYKHLDKPAHVQATLVRDDDAPVRIQQAAHQLILREATADFSNVFAHPGQFVDLPSYAWQRERHWLDSTPMAQGTLHRRIVHPLLGYALPQHSLIWEHRLDTERNPSLADHVVGGSVVFPGTGYVELALAASRQWHPDTPLIDIEQLEIRAPLILDNQATQQTRLSIDESDGTVRFLSRSLSSTDPWAQHFKARIVPHAQSTLADSTAPALPDRTPDFDLALHLQRTGAIGLDYGPAFQGVSHGWLDKHRVIAQLSIPQPLQDTLPEYHLHPALLDSALQLLVNLLPQDKQDANHVFVPAQFGRVLFRPGRGIPHTAVLNIRRRLPRSLRADVQLFNQHGQIIAALIDVRLVRGHLGLDNTQHLQYLQHETLPVPLAATPTAAQIPATLLVQHLGQHLAEHAPAQRYAQEFEPLIDALCLSHAGQVTQQALAPDAPTASPWLAHYQALLKSWPQDVSAEDTQGLWATLVREYPEFFPITLAVERIGMHLGDLLNGRLSPDTLLARTRVSSLMLNAIGAGNLHSLQTVLSNVLVQVRTQLPAGHRLGFLEISAAQPYCLDSIRACLDPDHGHYRFASLYDTALEQAGHLHEELSDDTLVKLQSADTAASESQPAATQLAVVHLDFDTLQDNISALDHSLASLQTHGGTLLVVGQHPALWQDFIFGCQADWWVDTQDGQALTAPQTAAFWQQHLAQRSQQTVQQFDFAPDIQSGLYTLLVDIPASDQIPASASTDTAHWWVVADTSLPDDHPYRHTATQLQALLQQAGHTVSLVSADDPQAWAKLPLAHGVIDLDLSPARAGSTDAPQLLHQTRRSLRSTALIQHYETHEHPLHLWLVTSQVHGAIFTQAPADALQQRFDDAVLWGFVRTLVNENPDHDIRLIDTYQTNDPAQLAPSLLQEVLYGDLEQEVILGPQQGRLGLRLRPQDAPGSTRLVSSAATQDVPLIRLGFENAGQLRHLRWEQHDDPTLADDEIEVDVLATGLNFRDVMYVLGLLSDEAIENGFAGPSLGLEFAGTVRRCGPGVQGMQPGDRVVGFGPSCFATRVITKGHAASLIPGPMSFESAATLPSTFFTAYYALHHLAHLQEGERVLIHGAAGGVGIAAIQIAQWLKAEIHATAGSDEKRDFLRMLGVQHIYDSRSQAFADEVLANTGGTGVDVVLNSLAGEAINSNFRVLRPFGRFLELGKRDFYDNTRIGLRPFRNNISYFGIDADQLMSERPDLTTRLFREVMGHFHDGTFYALPYTAFDANQIVDAFRHMQQARQIGKIVVTYQHAIHQAHIPATPAPALQLNPNATYLVTGGLSGFGLRTAQWLVSRGARHLALLGRRGVKTDEARTALQLFEQNGVTVWAEPCDTTQHDALAHALSDIAQRMPPLKGIVHAAAVFEDGFANSMTPGQFERVLAPKVLGAWHLHQLTLGQTLDLFIVFSSATTLFGNPGQSNYVAANHWLEALVSYRRAAGLAAHSVLWGAIDDAGFLARNQDIKDALQGRMGGAALSADDALDALEQLIQHQRSGEGVLTYDWGALRRLLPNAGATRYHEIAAASGHHNEHSADDIRDMLNALPDDELAATILHILKEEIGDILRLPPDNIQPGDVITDIGMDSLMGVELALALEARFGVRLPVMTLNDSPTIQRLSQRVMDLIRSSQSGAADDDTAQLLDQAQNLAARHGATITNEDLHASALHASTTPKPSA